MASCSRSERDTPGPLNAYTRCTCRALDEAASCGLQAALGPTTRVLCMAVTLTGNPSGRRSGVSWRRQQQSWALLLATACLHGQQQSGGLHACGICIRAPTTRRHECGSWRLQQQLERCAQCSFFGQLGCGGAKHIAAPLSTIRRSLRDSALNAA
eukprot:365247-Chlamydomonas_euryale.AAC.9